MAGDQVPIGIFVTASDFTDDAKTFAKGKKLQLIPGERLLSLISQLPEEQQQALASSTLAGDYITPTCPKCDVRMVLRTVSKGKNTGDQFWGCRNVPSCHQKLHLKRSHSKEKTKDDFFNRFFDIPENRSESTAGVNSRRRSSTSSDWWAKNFTASKSSQGGGNDSNFTNYTGCLLYTSYHARFSREQHNPSKSPNRAISDKDYLQGLATKRQQTLIKQPADRRTEKIRQVWPLLYRLGLTSQPFLPPMWSK